MHGRLNGEVVKWFPQPRGFGFLVVPSGVWYFCHYTAVPARRDLHVGDRVSFMLGRDKIAASRLSKSR